MSVLDDRVAWHQASVTQTLLVGGRREEEAQLSPSCPEGLGKEVPPPPPPAKSRPGRNYLRGGGREL